MERGNDGSGKRMRSYMMQSGDLNVLSQDYALPLSELIAKWNALADEAAIPEHRLSADQLHVDEGNGTFAYVFRSNAQLSGTIRRDGTIASMTYRTEDDPSMHVDMLMKWALVIAVTNLGILPNEVDRYFLQLDIGPNGQVSASAGKHVTINQGVYRVDKADGFYAFTFTKS